MEEAWVKELRSQFPVTEKSAFFDIAYENCGADYMERAIERFFRDKADLAPDMPKMGGGGKGRVVEVVASARKKLAAFLGSKEYCFYGQHLPSGELGGDGPALPARG